MGNVGVAAYGVVANLSLVITGIFTGVAEGAQPLFSECAGAGMTALWGSTGLWLACTAAEGVTLALALLALRRCPVLSSVVQ